MKSLKFYLSLVVSVCLAATLFSQPLSVTTIDDAQELVDILVGDNENFEDVSAILTGASGSAGSFDGGLFGIETGILLTSGSVGNAVGPNFSGGITTNNGTPGDADLDLLSAPFTTNDATILEITFTPIGDLIEFDYVFGSDEYNEYVCSNFNDPFGFFITGGEYTSENFALLPGTETPVTINNVNNGMIGSSGSEDNCTEDQLSNDEFFFDNTIVEENPVNGNCEYDGLTVVLTVSIPVEPGVEYTIRLAVADAGDSAFDSGVFLEAGSFEAIDFDCDDLQADFGDPCELPDGGEGIINMDCECEAVPSCSPRDIVFADFPNDTDLEFCEDDLPFGFDMSAGGNNNDDMFTYYVYDAATNLIVDNYDGFIIPDGWGPGTYIIVGVSWDGDLIGGDPGDDFTLISATECIAFSNELSITVNECEEFDCPDLQANVGDDCETSDGTMGTLDEECECIPDMIDPCPDLEGDPGDPCELADGSPGTINENCECIPDMIDPCPDLEGDPGDPCELADGSPGTISENCECIPDMIDPCPDLDGDPGDPCELSDGSTGTISENCECVPDEPSDCEVYEYYYADILEDGTTNIYEVSLVGSDAILDLKGTSEIEVHIALNEDNGLIYAVSKADGSFRTFDPDLGTFGPVEMLDTEVSEIVGATFNGDGKLMILSQSENAIYSVMLGANAVSVFDGYSPSLGGDIDFSEDGTLFLATREGFGSLYIAIPDEVASDIYVGDAPQLVTGLADMESGGSFLLSHRDATTFEVRAYDGTPGAPYDVMLDGESFMTFNGDLASGCTESEPLEEDCAYQLYYTHEGPGDNGYALWEVTLNDDNTASYVELEANLGGAHIALSPDGSTLYIVSGSNVRTYDLGTNTITNDVNVATAGGQNLSGFPSAVCGADGVLYAGDDSGNQVYTIDPLSGIATAFGPGNPLNGGDLIFAGGELWSINRSNNTVYLVSDGGATSFTVPVNQINGAAVLENGNVLVADGGTSLFKELDISDVNNVQVVAEYETGVALNNGDLAGRCIGINPFNPELQGACYATEMIEYVEGASSNGGNIAVNRTDATQALGEPERLDQLVFVSLGYGGSLTLGFDGTVPNMEGDDLEIVETTYGNNSCATYDEYADVYVSQNGEDFFFARTICRSDNMVDISDAGQFTYIMYVRIVNNDDLSNTPDAFDVDGVVALNNCDAEAAIQEGEEDMAENSLSPTAELSSFPNPTSGQSTVSFELQSTERSTLEVYDMNGRLVQELFSGVAEAEVEYRIDFDGAILPDGIYMYRLTTQTEVIIEKFIVTR